MRLLLHAGMHRTGSTDLQIFLERNRAALAAAGVGYPGEGRDHQDLAWALFRGDATGDDVAALLPRRGPETVVLSGEDFLVHRDLGWLKAVRRRAEVRVRIYLRRQDDWLNSWYNQHVKWPFQLPKSRMSPARFLAAIEDFHWLDLEATLGRWADALGEEAVETVIAAMGGERRELAQESADLLYHLLVLWADAGLSPALVWDALAAREGRSGIDEKKARK